MAKMLEHARWLPADERSSTKAWCPLVVYVRIEPCEVATVVPLGFAGASTAGGSGELSGEFDEEGSDLQFANIATFEHS